jgi:antitoxin component HigA of HigAB toxin-antitoxin module
MAKKATQQKVRRTIIHCPEYAGYLDEMPDDLKAIREARKEARKVKQ